MLKKILSQIELTQENLFDSKGDSVLHVAAMVGNAKAIEIILNSNLAAIGPDTLNANLATALHSAIIDDQLESVKVLIAYGADPNVENEKGEGPVLLCTIHSRFQILETLFEANESGKLSESLKVNAKDRKGLCAINCSAIKGELKFCRLLLEKGKVNIDEPSSKGCTALLYSSRGGYDQIVELLLSFGTDKNHQDGSGSTALHHACEKNFPEVVNKLVKAEANPDLQDLIGRTPIFEAVNNNSFKSLEVLLESSLDVNAIDYFGRTALFYAVQNNNEEMVRLLIEKGGADLNIYSMPNQSLEKEMAGKSGANRYSRTPIHAAAAIGNPELVSYLLSKGAKATEPGKGNNNALHISSFKGDIKTAKELIKAGVDVLSKNSKGMTVIDLYQKYHPEVVNEFMEIVKLTEAKPIEGELAADIGDEELSMQLDSSQQVVSDPRIGLIGKIFGSKVSGALIKPEKRYKGLRWIMKNYSSAGLEVEGLKALLAAVALGLEEKAHKMNLIALDLLESLILNAASLMASSILEDLGIIDSLFSKAMSTTDRLLNRILEAFPKIGELRKVGVGYLINKSMSQLRVVSGRL